jgi:hypothetical protein
VQRVISWAVSVGILVVVRHGGRRCFRFDFARLQSLPDDATSFVATERLTVAKPRPAATPETVPDTRPTVTPERLPVADARLTVVSPVTVSHPKVSEKESSKESKKATAREATRDATGSPVPKKATRSTQWPDGLVLTAEMIAYAVNRGMAGATQVADEFERFENYHKSKGSKFADWKLAFYNWVRNWEERRNKSMRPAFPQQTRMSTMQTEPGVWDRRDDELAMEHG